VTRRRDAGSRDPELEMEKAMDMRHDQVTWSKSTRCASGGCIEVATTGRDHLVRDSKLLSGSPILTFGAESWRDFLAAVAADEFVES